MNLKPTLFFVVIILSTSLCNYAQRSYIPQTENKITQKEKRKNKACERARTKAILSDDKVKNMLNESMNTVCFVPNKGQYPSYILYTFNTPQAQMLVFKNKIRLIALHKKPAKNTDLEHNRIRSVEKQIVDISFKGANPLIPQSILRNDAIDFNYFTGTHDATNIKAGSELRFNNIYEGITLRLYSTVNGSLEFDWLVSNPRNYNKIKMCFRGQDSLMVDSDGSLKIGMHFGTLDIHIPETYQLNGIGKKVEIRNVFKINGNEVSYTIKGHINNNYPLVIDPVITWGNYMDGNNSHFDAYLFGGDIDASGNIYIAGSSERIGKTALDTVTYGYPTPGYMPNPAAWYIDSTQSTGDGVDWLIMKVAKDGKSVLSYTFFGVASDNTSTISAQGLQQAHCIQLSPNGGSVFVGGFCSQYGFSANYKSLPPLSSGYTGNTAFGADSTNLYGQEGVNGVPCIAVFSADLSKLKYRTFIGNGSDVRGDIASIEPLNDSGFIMAAYVNDSLGKNGNGKPYTTLDNRYHGGNDIYIAKFNGFNKLSWGTYVGGNGDDEVSDMRQLSNGDIVFCGSAASDDSSMTKLKNEIADSTHRDIYGYSNRTSPHGNDALVGVIKADGSTFNLLSKVGGSGDDHFYGLDIGNCDSVFLIGSTSSTDFPNIASSGILQSHLNTSANQNVVLYKFASTGGPGYGSYFGGSGNDIGNSIAYLPVGIGELFVFGSTQSNDLPVTNSYITPRNKFYDSTYHGGYDLFLMECSPNFGSNYLTTYLGGTANDVIGDKGSPVSGKQMKLLNDSTIGIFTTSHSLSMSPLAITKGFDSTKNNLDIPVGDCWTFFLLNIKDVAGQIDAGDAPLSYGKATCKILDNNTHDRALITLGKKVDGDFYYPVSPGANADFDDKEGGRTPLKSGAKLFYNDGVSIGTTTDSSKNDEDALHSIPSVFMDSGKFTVSVSYYNHSGGTVSIYAYIDFNRNGIFEDGASEILVHTGLASNTDTARVEKFIFTIPAGTIPGKSYMRFVIVEGIGTPALTGCTGGVGYAKNQALGIGEVEDYPVYIYDVSISGTVYDDANGNTDNTVNGVASGIIGGVPLYANLVDSANNVVSVKTLPSNGQFTFTTADGLRYYDNKIIITYTAGTIGALAPGTTLPANLKNTGENFGSHNNAGSDNDATVNGSIAIQLKSDTTNITNITFGIDQLDTAFAKSYQNLIGSEIEYASGNGTYPWKVPLNASEADATVSSTGAHPFPGRVSGHDAEDGRYAGATGVNNTRTFVLTALPVATGAVLVYRNGTVDTLLNPAPQPTDPSYYYWNQALNQYEIPKFNADSLSLFAKAGANSITFDYAWRDAANIVGFSSNYYVSFYSPLPVELTSFLVKKQGLASYLSWTSASEKNLANYEIEHSITGTEFSLLNTISAKGNATQAQTYSYIDNLPYKGINYYRLRIVNEDGSYKYSTIQSIRFDEYLNALKVYPNPVTGKVVMVLVDGIVNATGSVALNNMLGEQIRVQPLTLTTGANKIIVDIANLPNGFYQVKIILNDQVLETRIELLR